MRSALHHPDIEQHGGQKLCKGPKKEEEREGWQRHFVTPPIRGTYRELDLLLPLLKRLNASSSHERYQLPDIDKVQPNERRSPWGAPSS